jgi:hypothetical protein
MDCNGHERPSASGEQCLGNKSRMSIKAAGAAGTAIIAAGETSAERSVFSPPVTAAIVQVHRRGAHIVTSADGIHSTCAVALSWQPHDVSPNGDDCLMHHGGNQR